MSPSSPHSSPGDLLSSGAPACPSSSQAGVKTGGGFRAAGSLWRLACLALVAVACRASEGGDARPSGVILPRYQPSLTALADAVRAHGDEIARHIATTLEARLAADQARGIETEGTRQMLEGFQNILEGRRLVESLDLQLTDRPQVGEGRTTVILRARTKLERPLALRPGGALLRVHRRTLTPEGIESRSVRTIGIDDLSLLEVSGEWCEVPLASFSTTIPAGALATRTHWTLDFLAGQIQLGEEAYPAQEVQVAGAERVDLAIFLPNASLPAEELVRLADRGGAPLAALVERTVRIAPDQRERALDLLTPLVEGMTAEEIEPLVPSLRWLSGAEAPGRDPLAWRNWLRARARSVADSR